MTEKTDNGLFSYQKKQNEYVTKTNIFKTRHDRAPNQSNNEVEYLLNILYVT